MSSDNEKNIPIEQPAVHRKSYRSPKLTNFGTVTQLTQAFANMMKADGGPGMTNMIS